MSKQTKIILGIVAGLVVLCAIACVVGVVGLGLIGRSVASNVKTDPTQASQVGESIATFTPPQGFQPTSSLNILGMKMVIYENGQNNSTTLMLLQMPASVELNDATLQQMQQQMERQANRGLTNLKTVENKTITVRGQPATEIIQEGTNSDNVTYRQMMVAFQGKAGLAMLFVTGPTSDWNQSAYDQMVQSIQ